MIRIGILGTARIARAFTGYPMDGLVIEAVASRDGTKAKAFADEFEIPQWYDSYDQLLESDTVDAVYIPLPPHLHCEYAVKAARRGKHILMEKPAAVSAAEVGQILTACENDGVYYMEGLMYRFMAIHHRAKELVSTGVIGTLRYIDFNFCFDIVHRGRTGYRTRKDEGGGALLDLGVYAVDFLRFVTDREPELLHASMIEKDVDEFTHAVFRIGDVVATMTCSFISDANYYVLSGSKGSVVSPVAISGRSLANKLTIHLLEGDRKYEEEFPPQNPYKSETEYFARAIAAGSPPFPDAANSLRNLILLDELRLSSIRL